MGEPTEYWILEHLGGTIYAWVSDMLEDPEYAADVIERMGKGRGPRGPRPPRPPRGQVVAPADTQGMVDIDPGLLCCEPGCTRTRKVDTPSGAVRRRCSRHERLLEVQRIRAKQLKCEVPGCENVRRGVRKLCLGHVARLAKLGELYPDIPLSKGNKFLKKQRESADAERT